MLIGERRKKERKKERKKKEDEQNWSFTFGFLALDKLAELIK